MQRCTICRSDKLFYVNQDLAAGGTVRDIAARYGVTASTIQRHKKCVAELLRQAEKRLDTIRVETMFPAAERQQNLEIDVLGEVRRLLAVTTGILDQAQAGGDHLAALRAVAESRRNIELVARLYGYFDNQRFDPDLDVTELSDEELTAIIQSKPGRAARVRFK